MPVPFAFSAATSAIPLSQLDTNFNTTITLGNTAIQLGNTVTTLNNMTLANVTISSGNVTITNVTVTTANVTTVNATTVIATTANVTTANVATSIVTGSETLSYGTVNGVAYLNGSKVLTTGSALTFDGSRFTVSAASPSIRIDDTDASGAFGIDWHLSGLGVDRANIRLNVNTGEMQFQAGASGSPGWFQTFVLSGSEQMRLTSTGLGIGTSSPLQQLHLSSASATGMQITFQGVGASRIGVASGNALTFGLDTSNGATERMRLDSSGNLGIGTSSPGAKLDVAGAARPSNATYKGDIIIQQSGTALAGTGGLEIVVDSGGSGYGARIQSTFNGSSAYDLSFQLRNNSASWTQRMLLDSSGNLGLGVTPSAWGSGWPALQVGRAVMHTNTSDGRASFGGNYYVDGTDARYIASAAATQLMQVSGQFRFFNAPSGTAGDPITFTQAMTLDASGNLGVGITSPTSRLHLKGPAGSNPNTNGIVFQYSTTTSNFGAIGLDNTSGDLVAASGAGAGIRFYTNSDLATTNERARITSGGDLLVGTTNAGGASGPGVKVLPAANGTDGPQLAIVTAATSNSTASLAIYSAGAAAYRFYVTDGGTIYATNTTISAISDQRFKENIQDLDVGLDKIMALKPRKFDWKSGKGKDIKGDRGFIAQELEQVFPDLVDEWADPAPEGEEPYKSVRQDLIPVLVKAIQELKADLDATKAELAALKGA